MPIYQTNVWVCEDCGRIETTTEEVSPYSDPVVALTDQEWQVIGFMPNERLVCPECVPPE
jgi:hypothetical protein